MASKKPTDAADEGFEASYKRLEETVAKLEQGNLSLEESLTLYEDGMKLARRCQELLGEAELRVTRLQEQFTTAFHEPSVEYGAEPEYDEDEVPLE